MTSFVHELISHSAQGSPKAIALQTKNDQLSYAELNESVCIVAQGFLSLAITKADRVGIYLAKNQENVQSIFACSVINAVFVPINPVLKSSQVQYIANDCQIKMLITNRARLKALIPNLHLFTELKTIIVIDAKDVESNQVSHVKTLEIINWSTLLLRGKQSTKKLNTSNIPSDLAAILYTSGSTGQPKGIMLSHTNIVLGAKSVSQYLQQTSDDVILAVLPLSFDYGLNQLMSSFLVGAKCILLDYLLASDVVKAITMYKVTGLAAVPPLWLQLTKVTWPENVAHSIRYFTNSGGSLPLATLISLRKKMPQAKPYLMYGLTEAFRSTFLSPQEIDNRPNSMGKAIPHAEILILREDGSECEQGETGELVHVGPLVSLGYWQNKLATEACFKLTPIQAKNIYKTPLAVFSGDYVKRDKEGFFYFVSRKDNMIKTSGYRVSPSELELVLLKLPEVAEAIVIGRASKELGEEIVALIVSSIADKELIIKIISKHCQVMLPNYMVPKQIILLPELPTNANGKVDIKYLKTKYSKDNLSQ
jgi:acyl-CoA ligase (AMP-forming) (exosortase A-associated)